MSQSIKRDAGTAFEDILNDSPHTTKRARKRTGRKSADENALKRDTTGNPFPTAHPTKTSREESQDLRHTKTTPAQGTPQKPSPAHHKHASKSPRSTGVQVKDPEKKEGNITLGKWEVTAPDNATALVPKTKSPAKPSESQVSKSKTVDPARTSGWALSRAKGGIFIGQDPILTQDDQYLILPTYSEVHVYAAKTSLLVRSFQVDNKSDITSCALSTTDPTRLYVSNSRGILSVWDWTLGKILGKHDTKRGLYQILPVQSKDGKETVLVLQENEGKGQSIVAYTVDDSQKFAESRTILQRTSRHSRIKTYAQGSILVVAAVDKLLIGQSQITADGNLDLDYTWRETTVSGTIVSFDACINLGKSRNTRKIPILDVAVGLQNGVISQYEDVLSNLISKEKKSSTESVITRKLHWHRTEVNTVKWSRDRNYLISGGNETVLVIWQLDTNQKQFLPHLSTAILGLTVSAAGSAYALRLADNSVMVLPTADLLPSTNVTGLALGDIGLSSCPLILHPKMPNQLLAAVPANPVVKDLKRGQSATFLQSYDVESHFQTNRQALTRNMTTALNVGPEGQSIQEPSVTEIAVSHDGKWLATVDEWHPPVKDVDPMYIDADNSETRGADTETSLRIWTAHNGENTWELVTRIDEPHNASLHSVLGLAVNPVKLEMATIGSDAAIRIWSPKARHRNGVAVRNVSNEQLYTWTCSRTIHCEQDLVDQSAAPTSAVLTYSDDGSVLAASWSWPTTSTRFVHLLDPRTGHICISQPDLIPQGIARIAFAGRYLLCLSRTLTVFDTLTTQITATIDLDPDFVTPQSQSPSYIAVNKFDGTIAISVSRARKPGSTKLVVFSIEEGDVKSLHEASFTGTLKGLLAQSTLPGYLLIDDRNRVRSLKTSGTITTALRASRVTGLENEQVSRSLDTIFGRGGGIAATNGLGNNAESGSRHDAPAITDGATTSARDLDSVLSIASSTQAPSPADLFQRVLSALAQK
ncbi:NET1-associated nuclear protein 1 [Elasticomyces elasticus]|uniref:NET1-associated nuclear protein 1 n=1 Tax=Exophiala sideris TaxID=1016849 RepID=A0ABR0IZ15_9EURO|nr:NET1-associated nuclear protein 1 [Elasticomyces elasticus]KAK5022898.1 NET1-associated nuclear protein 1 [Exophiala sideris]KAK5026424.1 NET1-associated nuclear protein 1 [Exophiala sideris]KAK5052359.1 NET1-associated nuclear protein 1 [Exophiala sideris]KAK5177386.1 NET1-associated nuclear protein 1 [Eurotiomycetes sp. CCFEE 6388]